MAKVIIHPLSRLFQFLQIQRTKGKWRLIDPHYGVIYANWPGPVQDGPDLRHFLQQFQLAEERWLKRGDRPLKKAAVIIRPSNKQIESLADLTLRKFHKILRRVLVQRLRCLESGKPYNRLYVTRGRPRKRVPDVPLALPVALDRLQWIVG